MVQRVLWSLILVAVVVSSGIAMQRMGIERANTTVELVMDYTQLSLLAEKSNQSISLMLTELHPLGVHQIALDEQTQFASQPIGFSLEELELIYAAGFDVVPRVARGALEFRSLLQVLGEIHPRLIIFSGNRIIGYPETLLATRETIADLGSLVGVIEFTNQLGIQDVASVPNAVRVHSITQGEMNALPQARIVSRYLRAVRERNIRVLYLRPYRIENEDSWIHTKTLISKLSNELVASGYTLGPSQPYMAWRASEFQLALVYLGVLGGVWVLILLGYALNGKQVYGGLLGSWLIILLFAWVAPLPTQQGMALASALCFPSLAVMIGVQNQDKIFVKYVQICGISLIGGVLITGILADTDFLLKLAEFRGVKIMHIAPVLFVLGYGLVRERLPFHSLQELWEQGVLWWNYALPVKYLAGLFLATGIGYIYLQRTGNFGLPVGDWEIALREGLERLLLVRPRTKEFLLGHPALYLILATKKRHPLLLSVAVVGQLSLVNTFTHVHTPLVLTVLRSAYGMIIGYAVGWLGYWLYLRVKGWFRHDSDFWILRLRQLGR